MSIRNALDAVFGLPDVRPMSARSVVASALLGSHPPVLPSRVLVATGRLFGIPEGTVRVALSRMVADGDLQVDDGRYRLAPRLRDRQTRQDDSRHPQLLAWGGDWATAFVVVPGREAMARSALRGAMADLRIRELREGVWMRPRNLDHGPSPALRLVEAQCQRFESRPTDVTGRALAAQLWDLDGWAATADAHRAAIEQTGAALDAGEEPALAAAFVLSAAVLRLLLTDPLLPEELTPADWPGQELRAEFDAFYGDFGRHLAAWTASQHTHR